jgi:predicted DNA-binding transcriptional regulator AlpA
MPDGGTLPGWPRFLRAEKAAAYLDVSKTHFLATIAPDLQAINLSPAVKGWLREDLDAWLDAKRGGEAPSQANNPWHD